jgi:hypothetical protein
MSRRARVLRVGLSAVVPAVLGAAAVLWWQSAYPGGKYHSHSAERSVREEFVPEQDLSLDDDAGRPIGRISVSDGLVALYLYTARDSWLSASVYGDSSRVFVQCAGNHEATAITVNANAAYVSDLKRGFIFVPWKDLTTWTRLRHSLMSSRGKRFDDSPNVPTEDVRLRNRQGWVFASLGLSSNGDPGIALADSNGSVRLTFFQRQLGQQNWWDLAIWDVAGDMRVSVELRPGFPPDVVHFADDIGAQYVADFQAHRLVHKDDAHSGALTWLPAVQASPQLPMQLKDVRGRKLWSAP